MVTKGYCVVQDGHVEDEKVEAYIELNKDRDRLKKRTLSISCFTVFSFIISFVTNIDDTVDRFISCVYFFN